MINLIEDGMVEDKADRFYELLLLLYPEAYRNRFGVEMLYTFQDMRAEERTKHGTTGVGFWFTILIDTLLSALREHGEALRKEGMKKYLQQTLKLNNYNLVSLILLLPFLIMGCIDLAGRILQGNLGHDNPAIYAALSQTPLYWYPILFAWVILFPILAVIISLIPLAINSRKSSWRGFDTLKQNPVSFIIITVGILLLAAVKLHDFLPCLVHSISLQGFGKLPTIISLCRNA
jgi:hypothetical protein